MGDVITVLTLFNDDLEFHSYSVTGFLEKINAIGVSFTLEDK